MRGAAAIRGFPEWLDPGPSPRARGSHELLVDLLGQRDVVVIAEGGLSLRQTNHHE